MANHPNRNYDCIGALIQAGIEYEDAKALRRISMTLHRWHELECGIDAGGIERIENARWRIEAKARLRTAGPRSPWLIKFRVYYAPTKDAATEKAEQEFRKDGYELLATKTTLIDQDDGKGPVLWYVSATGCRLPHPDRETPALKRLAAIMTRYPTLGHYVQGDPRGASLYILRPGDVPNGERADSYYSRGIAVYK